MPLGTDLSKLLRKDEPATAQEAESIRLGLNQLQSQASVLSGLVDAQGNLHHNVFSHKSGKFSQLPHETASMINSGDTPQSIPNNTLTAITYDADADLSAAELRFSWAHGIRRDASTGEFFLEGVPQETIWLFSYRATILDIPDLNIVFYIMEKDTATGALVSYETPGSMPSAAPNVEGEVLLRARKAATSWQLSVIQTNAGTAAKDIGWVYCQVARVR